MSITSYIKETKAEMKHVSWPTRKQSVNYTLLVIAISILTAILLGFFDFIFTLGLEKVVESRPYGSNSAIPAATSTEPLATSTLEFDLSL